MRILLTLALTGFLTACGGGGDTTSSPNSSSDITFSAESKAEFTEACSTYYAQDYAWQPPVAPAEWCGCLLERLESESSLFARMSSDDLATDGIARLTKNYKITLSEQTMLDSGNAVFDAPAAAIETSAGMKCARAFG